MPTQQQTTARHVTASERADRRAPGWPHALTARRELLGYGVLWIALAAFLWSRISAVDQFYLDELVYTHGAEYIWEHLPGGLVQGIPLWDRGPQRLYSTLLAPIWGPLGSSTAFTISHLLNVLLLTSAIVPAALLARRVIETPALRVLGVALAIAVPWLAIGAHLLAENLAFPLYVWATYAIVRAAEEPSLRTQIPAIALIVATALCRVNFASIFAVFVVTVFAAELRNRLEHRDAPLGTWVRAALRREWLVVAVTVLGLIAVVGFVVGGSAALGRYGIVDTDRIVERVFGDQARQTRHIMLTYARSLVVGSFVLPFVLGLAVAFAGTAGRLGRHVTIPAVAALSGFVVTVVVVTIYAISDQPEERYVFFVCAPIGVLAAAALEHLDALRRWTAAAGGVAIWLLLAGVQFPSFNAGNFFVAPASASWARVVDHRLRSLEDDLFGWLFIPATGWLLIALAIAALVAWIGVARTRPRLRAGLVGAGLVVCLAAQVAMLGYALKQELYGTSNAPGGIALTADRSLDRDQWVDATLPDDATAALVPPLATIPSGYSESVTFWSKDLDATVLLPENGSTFPVAPGTGLIGTEIGPNGLATWQGQPPQWLVAPQDDPRVQFTGRVRGSSPNNLFEAVELTGSRTAVWTGTGIEAGGGVAAERPATLTLDRKQLPDARSVELAFGALTAGGPGRWRVVREGRTVATGSVVAGSAGKATLRVPACSPGNACAPVTWELRASGAGGLRIDAARLGA